MTLRLYHTDSYLTEFEARVLDSADGGRRIYLEQTAFYPTSGGQQHDTGRLSLAGGGSAEPSTIIDVVDEGERIAHVLSSPFSGERAVGQVDWPRRFDHMQQHSGQHLLSAVFQELLGLGTAAVHFGAQTSTIDLEGALEPAQARAVEERANAFVCENRELCASFEDAHSAQGSLRKPSARVGLLRIISIAGLDRSACGGTHVARTGEIGAILLRKLERVRKGTRVEFVCGGRAVRRAAQDYTLLAELSNALSTAPESLPEVVSARGAELKATAATLKDVRAAYQSYRARELYEQAAPGSGGRRFHAELGTGVGLDELRSLAQAYAALPHAVFAGTLASPPTLLLATSEDSALHGGEGLKAVLTVFGGRGGGNARVAQGTVPNPAALPAALQALAERAR